MIQIQYLYSSAEIEYGSFSYSSLFLLLAFPFLPSFSFPFCFLSLAFWFQFPLEDFFRTIGAPLPRLALVSTTLRRSSRDSSGLFHHTAGLSPPDLPECVGAAILMHNRIESLWIPNDSPRIPKNPQEFPDYYTTMKSNEFLSWINENETENGSVNHWDPTSYHCSGRILQDSSKDSPRFLDSIVRVLDFLENSPRACQKRP